MKKLLKISTLALAMSALLFSCANPSGDSGSSGSSSGKVDIPSIKEEAKVPSVTLEEQTFTSGKSGVTKDNIKTFEYDVILPDLQETLYFIVSSLNSNENFGKEVLDPIMDKDGNIKNPITLKLSNKNYAVKDAAQIVITKGNVYFKETVEGGNPESNTPPTKEAMAALVDVDGSISIGGKAIKQLPNRNEKGEVIANSSRNNSIKALKANVKVNGGTNFDLMKNMEDIEGAVTAAINAKSAFETNNNAGYVTIEGNLTVKDIAAIYKAVAEAPENVNAVIGKLNAYDAWNSEHSMEGSDWYDKEAPTLPTETEMNVLYTWIDTLDAKVNVKVTFTDTTDANPYDFINIKKLSDLTKLMDSMTSSTSSTN